MIQTQTEVQIVDNSGLLKGRVIHAKKGSVGHLVKVTVTKAKSVVSGSKNLLQGKKPTMKGQHQDLLIIQTKTPIKRHDGCSITFSKNCGVAVNIGKQRKLSLGFKRINDYLPFDVKRINSQQFFRGSYNLAKLAKNSI